MDDFLGSVDVDELVDDGSPKSAELQKQIAAKNELENFCFKMKSAITDEKSQGKLTDADKQSIEQTIKEGLTFLETSPNASTQDNLDKLMELEVSFSPFMMRLLLPKDT